MKEAYRRTLCDIDLILNEISEEERNKIPGKLRSFIHDNRLENYTPNIKMDIPIENQELHMDTKAFLAMLYLNYWCKDEDEKRELIRQLDTNEEEHRKILEEKYSIENVFKQRQEELNGTKREENKQNEVISNQNKFNNTINDNLNNHDQNFSNQMITYKEPILKKIWNKIVSFFRRNGK